jgi:putative hydrolase of the HAD superfamily
MTTHDKTLLTQAGDRQIAAAFSHVDTWVFDLDNTLYPPDSPLWPQIDDRITAYVMELYGVDGLTARAMQKHFYERYGTTLRALIDEGHTDPEEFMDFVHDIDRSGIVVNLRLGEALARLPGRRLILTNGSRKHAEATAAALGILEHFDAIFDIKAATYIPKPRPEAFQLFFELHGVDPSRAAMFEDLVKNLRVPHEAGMKTVLIVPKQGGADLRDEWERRQVAPPYVEYVTEDIAGFLDLAAAAPLETRRE